MSTAKKARDTMRPKINRAMRGLMLEGLGRIMRRTPVDTGRARANWNASVDRPDTDTRETATLADVPAKQRRGQRVVRSVDFAKGDVGYIANGLPYIVPLEDGWSGQAPNGMVRVTMQELRAKARRLRG